MMKLEKKFSPGENSGYIIHVYPELHFFFFGGGGGGGEGGNNLALA